MNNDTHLTWKTWFEGGGCDNFDFWVTYEWFFIRYKILNFLHEWIHISWMISNSKRYENSFIWDRIWVISRDTHTSLVKLKQMLVTMLKKLIRGIRISMLWYLCNENSQHFLSQKWEAGDFISQFHPVGPVTDASFELDLFCQTRNSSSLSVNVSYYMSCPINTSSQPNNCLVSVFYWCNNVEEPILSMYKYFILFK